MSVFHWLYKFGLDVLLGIDAKIIKTQLVYGIKIINNSTKYYGGFEKIIILKTQLVFIWLCELVSEI